jgi:hypothetical protein
MLASPAGHRCPSRVTSGTGQVEWLIWPSCCCLTARPQRLHSEPPPPHGRNSCTAAVHAQAACWHGFLAISTAREVSEALALHLLQTHSPASLPFLTTPWPRDGHGPNGLRSWTPSAQGGSSRTAACTSSSAGHAAALNWRKLAASTAATWTSGAAAAADILTRLTPLSLSLRGRPGIRRVRSLAAEPMAVRGRPLRRFSWIAATVLATLAASARLRRWLASSGAGMSPRRAAALAASSALQLPACHSAGRPLATCCSSVRWLGIQLHCTSGLAASASARLCQQLPCRNFRWARLLPARIAVHMCSTALQSVMTMPP